MKLNWVEKLIVTNPIRSWFQFHIEGKSLLEMGGKVSGRVLEIGCGDGHGIDVIREVFGGEFIDAVDIDEDMVKLAKARHEQTLNVRVMQADVSAADSFEYRYDAIFDFAVLHHIPNWQDTLRDLYKLMNPGAKFYIDEYYKRLICNPLVNKIVKHPQENRFDHMELLSELEAAGFKVLADKHIANCVGLIVAQKPES